MSRLRQISTSIGVLLLAAPLLSALSAQTAVRDTVAQTMAAIASAVPIVAPLAMPRIVTERAVAPAPVVPAGVTRSSGAVASRADALAVAPSAMRASNSSPRSSAMMIVGGAAFIVGAVVGGKSGTAVMIGGGILGLVGLWNYLQ
ncbi:MAG TPA: hypothetical protein VL383_16680 [Gemmatimonadaceae bacterium]|jgi:hypothetical protein|nr:hypothetical protein [Gemmatimonadaceae bacterium]